MLDAYAVRKAIPRVVLAVIAINLSIYLCVAAVDITNIVGHGLNNLLVSPFARNGALDGIPLEGNFENTVATGSVVGLLGGGILGAIILAIFTHGGGAGAAAAAGGGAVDAGLSLLGFLLPLIITVVLISLAVLFTLVFRQGLLVFLTVISPIAIVCYILPGTEKYFKQWADLFIKTLVVYPIIAAVFAMSNVLGIILLTSSSQSGSASMLPINYFAAPGDTMGLVQLISAVLVLYAPLLLIPFAFKFAGGAMAAVMNAANGQATNFAGKMGNAIKEKRKNDPDSWLYKSRQAAYDRRSEQGLTSRTLGGGLKGALTRDGTGARRGWGLGSAAAHDSHDRARKEEIAKNKDVQAVEGNDTYLQAMEYALENDLGAKGIREYQMMDPTWRKDAKGNLVDKEGNSMGVSAYSDLRPEQRSQVDQYRDADGNLTNSNGNLNWKNHEAEVAKGTASVMRATSAGSDEEMIQYSAVKRAGLGTDYTGSDGVGQMQENISRAYGENTTAAAGALVRARELGTQARRGDLAAAGTGGSIMAMIEARKLNYEGAGSATAMRKKLMKKGLEIKSPQEIGGGRGESTRAWADAMAEEMEGSADEYAKTIEAAGGDVDDVDVELAASFERDAVRKHGAGSTQAIQATQTARAAVNARDIIKSKHDAHVKNLASFHGTLEVIGRSSREAQDNIGAPVMQSQTVVRKAVKDAMGRTRYQTAHVSTSQAMDMLRSDPVWRSRMREYGGAVEADMAQQGQAAMEAAAESARPQEPPPGVPR